MTHLADRYARRLPVCRPTDFGDVTDYIAAVTCPRCLKRLAALVLMGEAVIDGDLVSPSRVPVR